MSCLFCDTVCDVCRQHYVCSHCYTTSSSYCEVIDGKRYCSHCVENCFDYCVDCGKRVFCGYYKGDIYCSDCAECEYCDGHNVVKHINGFNYVCIHCLDNFYTCDECGDWVHCDEAVHGNDFTVCDHCYSRNYFHCEICCELTHNDECNNGYCANCYTEEIAEPILSSKFDRIPTTRFYGVEIETCDGYYEYADSSWLDVDEHCGREFVSPLLQGDAGLEFIERFYCDVQPEVNRLCGLHVHIDVRDLSGEQRLELIKAFKDNKDDFYSRVDPSRHNNTFCRNDIPDIKDGDTYSDYMRRVGSDRYCWINLKSISKHGSIEIRLHEATEYAEEVVKWVIHLMTFVTKVTDKVNV